MADNVRVTVDNQARRAMLVVPKGPNDGAVPVKGATLTPLGFAQDTTISAASGLPTVSGSIPAASTVALIQVTGQNCRWRDDGVDPTASVGVQLGAGTAFWYRGTFSAFKIIEEAASAVLNVTYYQEVAE